MVVVRATELGEEEEGSVRVSVCEEEGVDAASESPTLPVAVYLIESMIL